MKGELPPFDSASTQEHEPLAARASLEEGWAELPRVSGAECAWALRRGGFFPRRDGPDGIVLERGGIPVVRIPRTELVPELLIAVLKIVCVSPTQFVRWLEERGPETSVE